MPTNTFKAYRRTSMSDFSQCFGLFTMKRLSVMAVRVAELGRKRARTVAVDTTTSGIDNKLGQISTESQEGSVAYAEQLGIEAVSAAQALVDAGDAKPSYVEGVKKSVEQSLATGAIMREVRQSMDANDFGTAYGLIAGAERPDQFEGQRVGCLEGRHSTNSITSEVDI